MGDRIDRQVKRDTIYSYCDHGLPFAGLRALARIRAATLYNRLAALIAAGRVVKTDAGYRLANS